MKPNLPEKPFIVEIGCWEGRATLWMLENLDPDYMIVVDTFEGGHDHKTYMKDKLVGLEERFMNNLFEYIEGINLQVEKTTSKEFFIHERGNGWMADLIYVDGSHESKDVLSDMMLGWDKLEVNGIMVLDDYTWGQGLYDYKKRPQYAIDVFMDIMTQASDYSVVFKGHQVILRKLR